MHTVWTFHSAASLVYGPGSLDRLGESLRTIAARRVFLVTDAILKKLGLVDRVVALLRAASVECQVFDEGRAEPALHLVERAVAVAQPFAPDAVIGLGGGSNMDVAKFTAVLLRHGGRPHDYLGDGKIPGPTVPVVCIPTTAGTGSEVSGAAAFTDTDRRVKVGSLSNWLRPAIALVDPDLTLSCPPKVTADSGIDALTHAVEAYTAVDFADFPLPAGERSVYQGRHPLSDLTAGRAIELVGQHLVNAVRDGSDRTARDGMMLAATLAGMAFSNSGVALVHALEYPVGGATDCSHGEGNGLLLPHVMQFNLPARRAEFARIAGCLGAKPEAEEAVAAVFRLQEAIGIPRRLRDLSVREEQLPDFAEKAFALQRMLRVNPRPVTVESLLGIYQSAY
ncbi:MAG: iron-containing alcohol dehydrogenase [Gemmataceae bacterium]|nr:iron-containing alcohol dehydrogenase [Gemmataceae bacterium]